MSKRKGKSRATKYTPITDFGAYLPSIGDGGDLSLGANVRKYVQLDSEEMAHPLELNAWECRRLAAGLLKAADKLDGGQLQERDR